MYSALLGSDDESNIVNVFFLSVSDEILPYYVQGMYFDWLIDWSFRWVETMMPHALRAVLNLVFDENKEAMKLLDNFMKKSLAMPARKDVLLRKFSFHVATYYMLQQKDAEAEFHFHAHVLKNLLEEWAGTTPLNLHSHRKQLPLLQLVSEARRYIAVRSEIGHAPGRGKELSEAFLHFLADGQREPYTNDRTGIWHDVVTNRCFFSGVLGSTNKCKHPHMPFFTFFFYFQFFIFFPFLIIFSFSWYTVFAEINALGS